MGATPKPLYRRPDVALALETPRLRNVSLQPVAGLQMVQPAYRPKPLAYIEPPPLTAPLLPEFAEPPETPLPNPYVDYARHYTADGAIRLLFKFYERPEWRQEAAFLLWCAMLLASGSFMLLGSPYPPLPRACLQLLDCSAVDPRALAFNFVAFSVLFYLTTLVITSYIEYYRSIDVYPDSIVIDDEHVFWRHLMELGWPAFTGEEVKTLKGTYGTRAIDYTIIKRFDIYDRAPEVLVSHFNEALQQLWGGPTD